VGLGKEAVARDGRVHAFLLMMVRLRVVLEVLVFGVGGFAGRKGGYIYAVLGNGAYRYRYTLYFLQSGG
jgi:hypothetical protein